MLRARLVPQHTARQIAFSIVGLGALLLMMLDAPLVAAHAETHQNAPRTWYVAAGVTTPSHAIEGMVFLPGSITIDAGDSIVWEAGSADIHTVVFPGAGGTITPYNPGTYRPTIHSTYDGTTYTASPVLTVLPRTAGVPYTATWFRLTFTKAGKYTYFCTVHQGMQGTVVVQRAGKRYPRTEECYEWQTWNERASLIAQGWRLYDQAEDQATNHHVIVAIGTSTVTVMRFVRHTVVIHVGESITFTNESMEPHTVTFGAEPTTPGAINLAYGSPTHFNGSSPLNSGLMGITAPGSFTVTFTRAGRFPYYCALHDYMGMVGTVIVLPIDD